jgi:hypothetical protein
MTGKPKTERCETCRFWRGVNDSGNGECRRKPPAILADLLGPDATIAARGDCADTGSLFEYASRFPVTFQLDWCGEFEWLPRLEPMGPLC